MLSKNLFHNRLRQFAQTTPSWGTAIRYHTKPDEKYDLTLVARRVYGLPEEWPVIQRALMILKKNGEDGYHTLNPRAYPRLWTRANIER